MIVYLDFDGVLHPDSVYQDPIHGVVLRHEGETQGTEKLMEWAPVLIDLLEPYPDVKIILSTSWVPVMGYAYAKAALPAALQKRVKGATYHSRFIEWHGITRADWVNFFRYHQITMDVERNMRTRWLAIDNDAIGWDPDKRNHLVHTDDWMGLGDPSAQEDLSQKLKAMNQS